MSLSDGSGSSLSSLTSPSEESSTIQNRSAPKSSSTVQYVLRGIATVLVITVTGLNVLVVSGHMRTVLVLDANGKE